MREKPVCVCVGGGVSEAGKDAHVIGEESERGEASVGGGGVRQEKMPT